MGSNKKYKLKKGIIQRLFWIVSIIFILTLIVILLIKFIFNNKKYTNDMKIYEYVIKNNEMTKDDEVYVFKGEEENNYITYGNMMFRIVKIYKDGSMDIVTDESINSLYYDKNEYSFSASSLREYLNDVFLSNIDTSYLNKSPFCNSPINDISLIKCEDINLSSYVRLLSVSEYLDSYLDGKSYLNDKGMWLSSYGNDFVWVSNNGTVSKEKISSVHYVYPVITINNRVKYITGDGTKDNPFVITNLKYDLGSYVKIDKDMYKVINSDGNKIKLMLVDNNFLVRKNYSDKLIDYLNTDYYNELSYKNILEKYKLYTGIYDGDYSSVMDKNRVIYIGIPTVNDLKLDDSITDYYLINKNSKDNIYYYSNKMQLYDGMAMKLRIVIVIKNSKIKSGLGTYDDPYLVEV